MTGSILERIAIGDAAAVEECLARYGGLVWTLARRLGIAPGETEDAVQDAFVAIWRSAGRFDATIAPEAAFVVTVARRRIIDRRRSAERRGNDVSTESVAEPAAPPISQDPVEVSEEVALVLSALERLDPERRQVIELSVVKGLSHEGISKLLRLPLGTVKSHARRGLIAVRRMLGIDAEDAAADSGESDR